MAPLKKVVMGKVKLASKLAARALTIMDETVPTVLSPRVPLWTTEDVSCWIHQVKATRQTIIFYALPFSKGGMKQSCDRSVCLSVCRLLKAELKLTIGLLHLVVGVLCVCVHNE